MLNLAFRNLEFLSITDQLNFYKKQTKFINKGVFIYGKI